MDILTICLCILVLAGVFALVSLGVFLIHALTTLKDVSHLAQHLETIVSKVNVTVDDINYKMDNLPNKSRGIEKDDQPYSFSKEVEK